MARTLLIILSLVLFISPTICADDNELKLIQATLKGDTTQVKTLLAKGADVNAHDEDGVTALMVAEGKGYSPIVQLLTKPGGKAHAQELYRARDEMKLEKAPGKVLFLAKEKALP